ncbi:MAG: hypothetical protein V3R99_13455 [Thermoguttaceae bacterium]
MKSERRHDLEKNDLADRLAKGVETVKPYQNALLAGILLILVVTISYTWWVRRSATASEVGWDDFYAALTKLGSGPGGFDDAMSEFDDIIEAHPKTHLAHWTAAVAGDLRLEMGCNQLFRNKANAKQELKHAIELYEMLRSETRSPRLRQRAIFGLARATEATGTDLEKAKQLYEELSHDAEGVYVAVATRRAADLGNKATLEMYDKFAQFDPQPAYLDEPGIPGERLPFDLDTLSDGPPSSGPLFDDSLFDDPRSDGPDSSDEDVFAPPLMDLQETGAGDEPPVTDDGPTDVGTPDDPPDASPDAATTDPPETATPETADPEPDTTGGDADSEEASE